MHSQKKSEVVLHTARDAVKHLRYICCQRPLQREDSDKITALFEGQRLTASQLSDWGFNAIRGANIWIRNLAPRCISITIGDLQSPPILDGAVTEERQALVQPDTPLNYVKLAVDALNWCADQDPTVEQGEYINRECLKLAKLSKSRSLDDLALNILEQLNRADAIVEARFPALERLGVANFVRPFVKEALKRREL